MYDLKMVIDVDYIRHSLLMHTIKNFLVLLGVLVTQLSATCVIDTGTKLPEQVLLIRSITINHFQLL